jgi:hypothetical protein
MSAAFVLGGLAELLALAVERRVLEGVAQFASSVA